MKIGIDCRFWGVKHAGLGRYTRELVLQLLDSYSFEADFVLFIQKGQWMEDKALLKDCHLVEVDIPHYSVKEQTQLAQVIAKEKLDLMHFMHFNVPVLTKTPYIVTIHDLIKHFFKGKPVTTKHILIYWLKHGAYRFTIAQAVKKAKLIIVPSVFTKEQLEVHYPKVKNKIRVTYEGVSKPYGSSFESQILNSQKIRNKYKLKHPYFIYTGSAYPSKNLSILLQALKNLRQEKIQVQLLIACARNTFRERLKQETKSYGLQKWVVMPGNVPDDDLQILYSQAQAYVFPSLMEGFGLPGLEAMASSCPVMASNTGSLPEVYGGAALYFDPNDDKQLTDYMKQMMVLDDKTRIKIIKKGLKHSQKYTWQKTAQQTWQIYQEVLTNS